jgi:aminoglycoside phosphotransferase (APT) family kinase protein
MNIDKKVENYLKERFGMETRLISMEPLGEGVHGTAYRVRFKSSEGENRQIMKTLFHSRFGHDHYSDRAQVLLLANANFNEMPRHVRATDVVGEADERLISLKDAREFYIFMDEAGGSSYFDDLDSILKRGYLNDLDRERAGMLADFIADVHAGKYSGGEAKTLYRRRIRDLIGHGECIMGIIDAYEPVDFTSDSELVSYAMESMKWWGKIRDRKERLCSVHGDYHPGNIRLQENAFIVLDRSRGSWGEPADDVSCLAMNYVYYAVKDRGTFEGPFAELFRIFLDAYLAKTGDDLFFKVLQPFFAFRALVVANPKFYPDDTRETKRKLIDFGFSVLGKDKFEPERIPDYLEGK